MILPYPELYLTSIEDVKRWLFQQDSGADFTTSDNAVIAMMIERASQQIIGMLEWIPLPIIETRTYDYTRQYVSKSRKELYTERDLLSPTTVTNGDGTVIASSKYTLYPNNAYPKSRIVIKRSETSTFWTNPTSDNIEQVISIAGEWGYVPHYGQHWRASGVTLTADATSSATSLTCVPGSAIETYGYVRINDEVMLVTAVAAGSLTVERAALGTTATAHTNGDDIDCFRQIATIRNATTELATYLYKTKDRTGDDAVVFDNGIVSVRGLSKLWSEALMQHRNVYFSKL